MWKYGERLMKSVSHGFFSFLYVDWLRMEICAFLYWKQLRCVEGSRLPSLPHTKKKKVPYALFPTQQDMLHPSTLLFKATSSSSQSLWLNLKWYEKHLLRWGDTVCGVFLPIPVGHLTRHARHSELDCPGSRLPCPKTLCMNLSVQILQKVIIVIVRNIKIPLTTWNLFLCVCFFEP